MQIGRRRNPPPEREDALTERKDSPLHRKKLSGKVLFLLLWAVVLLAVQLYQHWFESLHEWGIYPRTTEGLPGILLHPFIHGDWGHFLSNLPALIIAMGSVLLFYEKIALRITLMVYLGTGVLVWLAARPSYHVGASGVIYGLVSFLFFSGIFRNDRRALALSLLTIFLNQGLVAGFVPVPGVSWESHLGGAIVGLIVAFFYRKKDANPEWEAPEEEEEDDDLTEDGPWNYRRHL